MPTPNEFQINDRFTYCPDEPEGPMLYDRKTDIFYPRIKEHVDSFEMRFHDFILDRELVIKRKGMNEVLDLTKVYCPIETLVEVE